MSDSDRDAPPPLDDAAHVRAEYADDRRLAGRIAFWTAQRGPAPHDIAFDRIVALGPRRVLEVGCGPGDFARRLADAGLPVLATDASAHMVGLAAARGVEARQGDVQRLPFDDGSFDVVVAAYMLYHVPDLERGLAEIARVLRPGGTCVAITNGERTLRELWDLVGRPHEPKPFSSENGGERLAAHFANVTRIDVTETFTVSAAAAGDYVSHTRFASLAARLPSLPDGLAVTAVGTVFVAGL